MERAIFEQAGWEQAYARNKYRRGLITKENKVVSTKCQDISGETDIPPHFSIIFKYFFFFLTFKVKKHVSFLFVCFQMHCLLPEGLGSLRVF